MNETLQLFDEAEGEIQQLPSDESFELGFEQFQTSVNRADCLALFDMAAEHIEHPERQGQVVSEVRTSHKRVVEAQDLKERLATVEKAIAPAAMTLKDIGKLSATGQKKATEEPSVWVRVPHVEFAQRVRSMTIDLLVLAIMGLPIGAVVQLIQNPEVMHRLPNFSSLAIFEWVSLTGAYLTGVCIALVTTPLYGFLFNGKSWGMHFNGLKLARLNGKRPTVGHLVIRCWSMPLSIITLGLSGAFRKDARALHELISRTTVVPEDFVGPDDIEKTIEEQDLKPKVETRTLLKQTQVKTVRKPQVPNKSSTKGPKRK